MHITTNQHKLFSNKTCLRLNVIRNVEGTCVFVVLGLRFCDLLAVVEDHGAVWPAVVVNQAQIWEKADSDRLKTPLVAHREAVAVDLEHST